MIIEDFDLDTPPKLPKASVSTAELAPKGLQKLAEGHISEARKMLAQAVMAFPQNADVLFTMGLFYDTLHKQEKMARWMDMALEVEPKRTLAWVLRSKYMEHIGRTEDALEGYAIALRLEPGHELATSQQKQLLGQQLVRIEPESAWADAEPAVRASVSKWSGPLPAFQENFLHPAPPAELQQPFLKRGVMAWDGVLSEELLKKLESSVDDYFQFAFTNSWLAPEESPGTAATSWLPSDTTPVTAAELAARCLLKRILREDPSAYAGVEFWARVRIESLGAALHYDQAEVSEIERGDWVNGNPWRPEWSSVLYLTDEGGPTVVLEQLSTHEGRFVPEVPQKAHLVMPRRNRWAVFRADLFHGTLPVDYQTRRMRKVFIFNFWRRHRPAAPYCQRLDYSAHPAMKRLVLSPTELKRLEAAEAQLKAQPKPVRPQRFATREEMPHSSDFGRTVRRMPMPAPAQLKASTGLVEIDWAAAVSSAGEVTPDKASASAS